MRATLIAIAIAALAARSARASCMATPAKQIVLVVTSCAVVDLATLPRLTAADRARLASRYAGVVVTGTVSGHKELRTFWIPASEHASCAIAAPTKTLTATLGAACCDGDDNPPCYLGTSDYLSAVYVRR